MTAFMWVKGSTRSEAVKCWFECVRASKTDPKYEQTNKDKFMENNPNWTDEMYDVKMDAVSHTLLKRPCAQSVPAILNIRPQPP